MARVRDSVFDEPALAGRLPSAKADAVRDEVALRPVQDNLAGTPDEIWEEPTVDPALRAGSSTPTHRERVASAWDAVTPAERLKSFVFLVLVSCALGIVCSLVQESIGGMGPAGVLLFVPVIEELGKTIGVITLLERRPWLIGGSVDVFAVCALSGLFFATAENLLYLRVYFPDASPEIALWRWTVCTALHVVCCLVSAVGLAGEWRDAAREKGLGQVAVAVPWLVAAMVIHGLYNAFATVRAAF